MAEKLIFEISQKGKKSYTMPCWDGCKPIDIDKKFLRTEHIGLAEVSEPEIVRHYVNMSNNNHHVDKGFYPLGSCTMKYNPKINEKLSSLDGFTEIHPYQPEETVQGVLKIYHDLADMLCKISGFDKVTLQPVAGAHGEWTGLKVIRAFHESMGKPRKKIIIPDTAHGTNPASIVMAGYEVIELKSTEEGLVDIEELRQKFDEETAAFMITNPNTLGLFEKNIKQIAEIVHSKGGLLYLDGANFNALLGIVRPAELGFDVMHYNLHKTFSTPHGGGGPGSGPIGVVKKLEKFLPVPDVVEENGKYNFNYDMPDSIGKVHSFYGNFLIVLRAYIYMKVLGSDGLHKVSENAIINANYIKKMLEDTFDLPYKQNCMHEVVFSSENLAPFGIRTLDVAKRLLDFGIHAPTIYFPLLVHESMMIEPTETESKDTLDDFIIVMKKIAEEAKTNPELLKNAPTTTPVRRLDEVMAAKNLNVRYEKK
ncbi:MAG: aminomethyl-transferring glycine dehydrogenase subunit GcvPB [Candidatus Delongbacteria bacterium]|nr:aminomethyl-transferring glycine dehydrogenase subunit GcvPB [Candidatus Delongbacteria bacterium]MCG2760326.1 aminomethyl-transferring glycine dehydrogenase subunit GcvPB [Candidatus Delongbacteria bacterium]